MSLSETLQEISQRHHAAIKILQGGPRGGGMKGGIGEHHLAMAKESCEAIADDFINAHYNADKAPTKQEMEAIEKTLNDKVKQCRQTVGYTLLASTNEQFQYVVQPVMYKIRKAFEGFKSKNKIGF
jgi:3-oxoacyl-(acyl-carrier-protein) synthase